MKVPPCRDLVAGKQETVARDRLVTNCVQRGNCDLAGAGPAESGNSENHQSSQVRRLSERYVGRASRPMQFASTAGRGAGGGGSNSRTSPYLRFDCGQERIGLVTNPDGSGFAAPVDRRRCWPPVARAPRLAALFGPEHGYLGYESAEKPVASTDRVHSLLRTDQEAHSRNAGAHWTCSFFDIQDLGVRASTPTFPPFSFACRPRPRCADPDGRVLDRPNPIGGDARRGAAAGSGIPLVRGNVRPTNPLRPHRAGELALYVQRPRRVWIASLQVVPLAGLAPAIALVRSRPVCTGSSPSPGI